MKKKLLVVILSLIILLIFPGLAKAQFGSISGKVTDEQTGFPIMGAHVWARADTSQLGGYGFDITDSLGLYLIDSLAAGVFLVSSSAQGYENKNYADSVIVVAGENTPDIDFALTPVEATGTISGMVTDGETGLPLPMAHVWAYDSVTHLGEDTWTDTVGYYLIQNLTAGEYAVGAYKSGYEIGFYPELVAVEEGQNTPEINFALTPTGEYGSISGRVTDEQTGLPLPMAHVWAFDSIGHNGGDAWTDTAGLYLMQNLVAGQYIVGVHKDGYEDEVHPESVVVEEGQNTPDINFALTPASSPEFGSISGRVTDDQTGLPIEMAEITITGIYSIWYTDSTGHYLCDSIPPGVYQIKAYAAGYHPETYPDTVGVIEGQNTPHIDFALTPVGEYSSISGKVIDEQTGISLPMAHIWAYDSAAHVGGNAWTDTTGYYLIQNLVAGQYVVGVHKDGYEDEFYPELVTVQEGQNTPDIDFALTPIGGPEFGSITGWVGDEETGLPIIMAYLRAIGLDNEIYGEAWSDTGGQYGILDLPPGIYRVVVSKDGYTPEAYPDSVIVIAGQNTPSIDFSLTPIAEYGSISGRVTDEQTDLPISMAHLIAIGLDNWCYAEAWSDTSGYYTIQYLCPGIYQVNVHVTGYIPEIYPDSVTVLADENTLDIDFALTPIHFGDVTGDGEINLTDAVYLANYCLKSGLAPDPLEAGEVNCDNKIDLSDVIYIANYYLKAGPAPNDCEN